MIIGKSRIMKKKILTFSLALASVSGFAQNEIDALRYSENDITGSARFMGLSGAMSAMGNDLSAITINPAGVAVFNKTQFGFSTGVAGIVTEGSFLGQNSSDTRMNVNIGNAGFVARFKRKGLESEGRSWNGFSMGLNYTRHQSFHRNTYFEGVNNQSSLIDQYVYDAEGTDFTQLNSFGSDLAWQTWLIDTPAGGTSSYERNVLDNYGHQQQIQETTKGFKGQTDLSFGGNYANTLYIGGSIGYQNINFRSKRNHTEIAPDDTSSGFQEFTQTEYLRSSGSGVNLKFGVIYRPVDWFRIGASIHSPTFFTMEENYSTSIISVFDTISYSADSPEGSYKYKLQTPFRVIGGLAFVIAKTAVFSVDYEHIDYSMARFRASDYSFSTENANIKNYLKSVGSIRAGVEVKLKKFFIRGGFGMNSDPYSGKFDLNDSKYSLGFGWKGRHFMFDLAYQLQRENSNYLVYDVTIAPIDVVVSSHNVMASVGVKF